jgi:uncharacterized membrane protein
VQSRLAGAAGGLILFAVMDQAALPSAPVHWQIVLRPHRSLPPSGFRLMMLLLGLVSLVCSLGFVLIGAWPVCGFFGLDVLLIYLAFRASYRSGRARETVRLAGDDVTVEKVSVRGELRFWRMQAFWLKVRLIENGDDSNRLLLTSHGRTLAIGGFLSPPERRDLAGELDAALRRWRAVPN